MKILAIRGKNLASLAGEFDIPFTEEPLASAGLFAISGPTGSGKSTLLDALCLALYDDTPRLLKAGGKGVRLPDVAGETVTPGDTSTLLRRGAAEGYSEVDFVGNDGRSYRARWSVRRSKARADGKLQKSAMSLMRLPELQGIGGTNTEVKAEIVQRIGLSFEQFTRSVLLAQNEFSAFLKADDNERGELLETLTGIDIYSTLSRRAFERAKLEQLAVTRLNDRLVDQKPLSPEAREQLEQQSLLADQSVLVLEQNRGRLTEHLRWHEALDRAQLSEQQSLAELAESQAEQLASAPRRAEFLCIEAVQPARTRLADCERTAAEIVRQQQAISQSESSLGLADQALQSADESLASERLAWQRTEQQQADAQPDLEQARVLDTRLDTLQPLYREALQIHETAVTAETRARQVLLENEQQRRTTRLAQQLAEDWLAQHPHLENLAAGWPRWDTLLVQASRLALDKSRFDAELAAALQLESQLTLSGISVEAELKRAEHAMKQAIERRTLFQEQLDRFDVPARLARKQADELRRELLLSAESRWRELSSNLSAQWKLDAEAERLQDSLRQAETALAGLAESLPIADARLAQAERSLKSAESACAEQVETLRAELKDNEACPVCGAHEHPYRSENPRLHALLEGLRAEVMRCRTEMQQLQHQQTSNHTVADRCRRDQVTVDSDRSRLAAAVAMTQAAWQSHALEAELGEFEFNELTGWFSEQQQITRLLLQATDEEEAAERDAATARDGAQAESDKAVMQHGLCKDVVARAAADIAKGHAECAAATGRQADAAQRLDGVLAELDGAFDNQEWMQTWRSDPAKFYIQCQSETASWHAQCRSRDEFRMQSGRLDAAGTAQLESLTRAGEELRRTAIVLAESREGIEQIQFKRSALLGGKPVSQIQGELAASMAHAKKKLAAQEAISQQYVLARTRSQEALEQAVSRLEKLRRDASLAEISLEQWLSQFNQDHPPVTLDQLKSLLACSDDWISDTRNNLQQIDLKHQKILSVLQERQAQLELIGNRCPTEDSAEQVQSALNHLADEWQSAQAQATALQLDLAQDRTRRIQSAAMMVQIEKQEAACRIWAQMNELIGSADGKKFRNYAQQFTLDVLTGYANRHLEELSRRYRLERIVDTLALMVVDQDMGDELRSVHSLSGGESFLVSLALALGLASLSSNRVRVESLFIDEGFGSLDPETLSVAMDALDGLQAMGRKVGVISHVQEMTERIPTKILVQRLAGGRSQVVIE